MARARAIDTRLEKLVPSMEEYFIAGIFTKDELRAVAKERTRHEYKIVAKPLLLLDVEQAIQYELNLERRLREYCAATSVNLKHRWVVQDRVTHIYKIGMKHLKDPQERETIRKNFVSTMRKFDRKAALSNHYATYVTKFPNRSDLWSEAALWEVDIGNTDAARTIIQHALEHFSDKSVPLWVCSLSIEMRFLSSVMAAMLHDLAERQAKAPESAIVPTAYEAAAAADAAGGGALLGIVFDEALAKLVIDGAVASPAFGSELFAELVRVASTYHFSRNVLEHLVTVGVPQLLSLRCRLCAPELSGTIIHRGASTVGSDDAFADAIFSAVVDMPSRLKKLQTVRDVLAQVPPQPHDALRSAHERFHLALAMQLLPKLRNSILRSSPALQRLVRDTTIDAAKDVAARAKKTKADKKNLAKEGVIDALKLLAERETHCSTMDEVIAAIDSVTQLLSGQLPSCKPAVNAVASLLPPGDIDEPSRQSSRIEPFKLWLPHAIHSLMVSTANGSAPSQVSPIQEIVAEDDAGHYKPELLAAVDDEVKLLQQGDAQIPMEVCAACRWAILEGNKKSSAAVADSDDDDQDESGHAQRKRLRSTTRAVISVAENPLRVGSLAVQQHPHATLGQDEAAQRGLALLLLLHASSVRAVLDVCSATMLALTKRAPLQQSQIASLLSGSASIGEIRSVELLGLLRRIDNVKQVLAAAPPIPRQCYTDVLLPIGEAVVQELRGDPNEVAASAIVVQWFEQLLALFRNGASVPVRKDSTFAKAVLTTDLWRLSLDSKSISRVSAVVGASSLGQIQALDRARYINHERNGGNLVKAKQLSNRALKDAIDARTLLVTLTETC